MDTHSKPIFEVTVPRMVNTLKRNHSVVMVSFQRVGDWFKKIRKLAFPHAADLKRCPRRINHDILDMNMAQIPSAYFLIPVGIGQLVTPTIVAQGPKAP